jgi:hypothetical protein
LALRFHWNAATDDEQKEDSLPQSLFWEDQAQGKRRNKFETINEVWKIAPSTQRIALRTSLQYME